MFAREMPTTRVVGSGSRAQKTPKGNVLVGTQTIAFTACWGSPRVDRPILIETDSFLSSVNHGVGRLSELRDDRISDESIAIASPRARTRDRPWQLHVLLSREKPTNQLALFGLPAGAASHSFSFDHRRRPETLRTAIATAFFWPTSTTSRFPRVTPV